MQIELLIDRVGNVNVFNIFEDERPSKESHLKSVMDDDLIIEYVREIENLARVANTSIGSGFAQQRPDILKDLKMLGETFFDQFFPPSIIEKIKLTVKKFLHFHLDPSLNMVPWELLHDGNSFLGDKFCIGKTVKGDSSSRKNLLQEKLKMLIISDPTEDLPWAQKEGEELFQVLREKVPESRLQIEFIGGKQITKLKLLSMIRGKNIIHYSGHLHFSSDPLENGWLLSGDKILKAREIKNSGFDTDLVFSNSCNSSANPEKKLSSYILNNYAGSFLQSGIRCFIGTNWELPDSKNTLDFTIRFYTSLFSDKTVGEALFIAREYGRRNYASGDLTWANYTLHGQPNTAVMKGHHKNEVDEKIINPSLIQNFYPTTIARSYTEYIKLESSETEIRTKMSQLIQAFEEFSKVVGSIIFSDRKFKSLLGDIPDNADDAVDMRKWWDLVFASVWEFKKLEISPESESLLSTINTFRDTIQKMVAWSYQVASQEIANELLEGYLVTFQYYFENLLLEMKELEKILIVYVSPGNSYHYFFRGIHGDFSNISAPMMKDEFISEQFAAYKGKPVILFENTRRVIPMVAEIRESREKDGYEMHFPGYRKITEKSSIY